jgi:hypothetical protein
MASRAPVIVSTSLLWRLNRGRGRMDSTRSRIRAGQNDLKNLCCTYSFKSSPTRKPRPPAMTIALTIAITTGSLPNLTRLSGYKENPALQNAEIA